MRQPVFDFGFPVERLLRLSVVEKILASVISPGPCYNSLRNLCEEGTLEGRLTPSGWLVTERSIRAYVHSLQPDDIRQRHPLREENGTALRRAS